MITAITAFKSELIKLFRPLVLWGALGLMVAIAVLATVLVFAFAKGSTSTFNGGRPGAIDVSIGALAGASRPVRGFAIGAGFGGAVLLITFAVSVASEYSTGTLRTLLLAEPRRMQLIAGKLLALVAFICAGFLVAALAAYGTALICAPLKGIDVTSWFTLHGLKEFAVAYGDAVLAGAGWGLFGAAVAIICRSMLLTLAVTLVWFFPIENILHTLWSGADRWFPGLLLQGIHAGGFSQVSWARTGAPLALYLLVALGIACWSFARRDVTA